MSTTLASVPSTYQEALYAVEASRTGEAKVGNNTWVIREFDNGVQEFRVRLHRTYVATVHADDSVTLRTGGWYSVTTKDRLNRVLGNRGRVHAVKGQWYFTPLHRATEGPHEGYLTPDNDRRVEFVEGLHVGADGTPWPEDRSAEIALRNAVKAGTYCECGASWDSKTGGYACAR